MDRGKERRQAWQRDVLGEEIELWDTVPYCCFWFEPGRRQWLVYLPWRRKTYMEMMTNFGAMGAVWAATRPLRPCRANNAVAHSMFEAYILDDD